MDRDRFIVYEHDHVGQTALHWAAKRGNCEIIKVLIKNGIKVN
jgi:ankyrin repeat protein